MSTHGDIALPNMLLASLRPSSDVDPHDPCPKWFTWHDASCTANTLNARQDLLASPRRLLRATDHCLGWLGRRHGHDAFVNQKHQNEITDNLSEEEKARSPPNTQTATKSTTTFWWNSCPCGTCSGGSEQSHVTHCSVLASQGWTVPADFPLVATSV